MLGLLLLRLAAADCKCEEWVGLDQHIEKDDDGNNALAVYPYGVEGPRYFYDVNYGNLDCLEHDQGTDPYCSGRFPPQWCTQAWCYVDKSCDRKARSKYFPDEEVYYSYAACGSTNSFDKYHSEGSGGGGVLGKMISLIEGYVLANKIAAEGAPTPMSGGDPFRCVYDSSCPCEDCASNYWPGNEVNFESISVLPGHESAADDGTCLANAVADTYLNVAASEYEDWGRVGYQYFGHQQSGGYGQWPLMDLNGGGRDSMCQQYDPRFRDWYAGTATGPKDIVLVLDDSGSMRAGLKPDRYEVAREAAKMVVETLGRWDYMGVVLFEPVKKYSQQLVRATPNAKTAVKKWLDKNMQARGGTNFINPLKAAFNILDASLQGQTTSKCTRAILFLTDGEAGFTGDDYNTVRRRAEDLSVALFTYAVGSGANTKVTKNLACQNRGIFYKVDDGADLGQIMSKFFLYFAKGVQSCTVRWTEYDDLISGQTLLAGCLPFYGPNTENPPAGRPFRGVSCIDMNVVVDLDTVKAEPDYDIFQCQTEQISQQCAALYLRDCDLAQLRMESGADSVCPAETICTTSDGYCVKTDCQDDLEYKDRDGFTCDTWVGDNCFTAAEDFKDWGYTMEDQKEILRKCPYSCLACEREMDPEPCNQDCDLASGNVACRGEVGGGGGGFVDDSSAFALLGGAFLLLQ